MIFAFFLHLYVIFFREEFIEHQKIQISLFIIESMLVKAVRGIYPKSFPCLAMILFMVSE